MKEEKSYSFSSIFLFLFLLFIVGAVKLITKGFKQIALFICKLSRNADIDGNVQITL